jgi:hypothetical protein
MVKARIKIAKEHDKDLHTPTPSEGLSFKGRLDFSCCGVNQFVNMKSGKVYHCNVCGAGYNLWAVPRPPSPSEFLHGSQVKLKKSHKCKRGLGGPADITLKPGVYTVVEDYHGILGELDGITLLRHTVKGVNKKTIDLALKVPSELLERYTDGGEVQDSES